MYISRLSLKKKPEKGSRTWSLKFLTEIMMGSLTLLSLWQVYNKTTEKVYNSLCRLCSIWLGPDHPRNYLSTSSKFLM